MLDQSKNRLRPRYQTATKNLLYKKFLIKRWVSLWNYERNLEKKDPYRADIALPVWGNTWENLCRAPWSGIAQVKSSAIKVEVKGTMMYLTFKTARHDTVAAKSTWARASMNLIRQQAMRKMTLL